ncbi:UDP-N-acetylmuramoyl-L-alanyl-D-glutamate--2,6-diaminopimelate ligase [Jatrophihabitans cynanchi]|uniref:UDP-N-acetylmuramoyl-L-alanyl-D-glutamate--2,6-diaminopimelate ligase n=1 Tax=Jatrophihabitans cynanchi TaxID=2944128 RepID=A0ABY7K0Z7_9ACTN|nr:UDP-N-acetylmuramoyl-L-alanyl-D-glutamate--2,6-diaminopimelate ligase [Jatrophihabitans sp. SB3-54]WAX56796.1 UDP-N-acetylmuramoyl-L-alanyl-D-glutamate--2,6-diaminopimelate ligase [Jatrophihabitans sp. SB3-54]
MPDALIDAAGEIPRPAQVEPVRLRALRLGTGRVDGAGSADVAVSGVTATSAAVRPGDLFAALPGRTAHGAAYVPQALASGAVAVLTDPAGRSAVPDAVPTVVVEDVRAVLGALAAQVYGDPSRRLRVQAVTGTSGKTTTTYFLRAGLRAAGRTTGLIGTVATLIGDREVKTGFTTPEAPEVHALLAVMAEAGVGDVAMEVSSHALAMGRVDGVRFETAAFTNLSQDHLDFHADMADYFAAKARLFDGRARNAVVVTDDEWGVRMAAIAGPEVVTVNTGGDAATWRASEVRASADGHTRFRVLGPHADVETACAVPGRYNVANALLAIAMLEQVGVPVEVAAPAVAVATVPGRMERIDAGQPFLAIVDYSHKPAAVDGALRALRPLTRGRLIIVLGCGGDRDRGKRPHMGAIAARAADLLVITDDNPRSEDPAAIRGAMRDGALAVPAAERGEVIEIGDRAAAIAHAVDLARVGDTVLVAGKGHEAGQEIAGTVHPFDDRSVLRHALEAAR